MDLVIGSCESFFMESRRAEFLRGIKIIGELALST